MWKGKKEGEESKETFKVAGVSMSKLCQNRFSFSWRCDFAIPANPGDCGPHFESTQVRFHFPAPWLLCNQSD